MNGPQFGNCGIPFKQANAFNFLFEGFLTGNWHPYLSIQTLVLVLLLTSRENKLM
jgi:hypothetical protein